MLIKCVINITQSSKTTLSFCFLLLDLNQSLGYITGKVFFNFVDKPIIGNFMSVLNLLSSNIHNLLFFVKCTRQQFMEL